jgi:hypothetical protein
MNDITYSQFPKDKEIYVFLVRANSFLAKSIRLFMYIKQMALKKSLKNICNHADLCLGHELVIGAERRGVYPKSIESMYGDGHKRTIFVYKVQMPDENKQILKNWAMNQAGKKYEFSNFINQIYRILYIIFKGKERWLGHRKEYAQKRYFCSEFVSTALTQVIPDFSETPWDDDPMDLKEICGNKLEYVTTITMKHGE